VVTGVDLPRNPMLLWCALALAEPDATIVVEAPVRDPQSTSAVVTVVQVDERLATGADVASAVDVAPGTTVRRLGGLGNASGVSVRGGGLRQTLVLLDGVPLNPDGGATVNLTELPLQAFGSVDVYRGGVPAELGANAMGGVVNLHSADGQGPLLLAGFGTLRSGRLSGAWRGAGERVRGTVMTDVLVSEGDFEWFDDVATRFNLTDDATRVRENNDTRQLSAHATVTVDFGGTTLTFLDSMTASEAGVPGPAGGLTEALRFALWRNLGSVQLVRGTDSSSTTLRGWASIREERLTDPLSELGPSSTETRDTAVSAGLRAVQSWVPSDALSGSLVLDGRLDSYQARDIATSQEDELRQRAVVRGSMVGHWRTDTLAVDPTVEALWIQSVDGPRVALTPSIGARLGLGEVWSLKARVQRTVRPPDLLELYGDRGAIVGNENLKPEVGTQVDFSAIAAWEDGSVEVTPFYVVRQDGIVYIQNAQRTASPVNLERTEVLGVELFGQGQWGPLDLRASASFTHSSNGSPLAAYAGKVLPRTPAVVVENATGVTTGPWRFGHQISVSSRSYLDPANQLPSPSRVLNGVFARAEVMPSMTLELAVSNLFDERVQPVDRNPLSEADDVRVDTAITDFTGYPLAGRTGLLTLRWAP
jgi:vitamin B12 transporter